MFYPWPKSWSEFIARFIYCFVISIGGAVIVKDLFWSRINLESTW